MIDCQLCSVRPVEVRVEGLFRHSSPTTQVSTMRTSWRACADCAKDLVRNWFTQSLFITYRMEKECCCPDSERGTLAHAISHGYWPGGES